MKIYFIDKYGKNLNLKTKIEKMNIATVEAKEDLNYRINKTDFVITMDFNNDYEEYKKVNNLIIVTEKKNPKEIYNMITNLNTRDVIAYQDDIDYIAERIKNKITGE